MAASTIRFLGTSACVPDAGDDTACFLLDGKILVDTGWQSPAALHNAGIDPASIPYLVITHWHHDHCLSLPQILFSHLCAYGSMHRLTLIAPQNEAADMLRRAMEYLQTARFYPSSRPPRLAALSPGESFIEEGFALHTVASLHAMPGLCWRYAPQGGPHIGFTGDTAYQPELAAFYAQVDVLIHECSLGPVRADPIENARYLHSGAIDAGRVAREAGAKRLVLVHGSTVQRDACIAAASKVYSGPVLWPRPGEIIKISK